MTLEDGDTVLFHLSAGIYEGPQNARGDFLATVWLHEGKLNAEYRFRWWATSHKLDMDGGLDDDKKSFYRIGPVEDEPANRETGSQRASRTRHAEMARKCEMKSRLVPSRYADERFARLLAKHRVPTMSPRSNPAAAKVPAVCAEFYENWYVAGRTLAGLKIETVARIAATAWVAEGGKAEKQQTYQVKRGSEDLVRSKGHTIFNGKFAGELVTLTWSEAAGLCDLLIFPYEKHAP